MTTPCLRHALGFLGIPEVEVVAAARSSSPRASTARGPRIEALAEAA